MNKKITAGILAFTLVFGSAALPAETFVKLNAGTAVMAEAVTSEGYQYELLADGTAEITSYTGSDTEITIPSEIDGVKVTSIGKRAVARKAVTSVVIPNTVTNIGAYAFNYCTALESITIPDSVETIGENAFSYCKKLTSVTVPSKVTRIEDLTFNNCQTLTKIDLPDNLTYIGKNAFGYCKALSSIDIPDSVTYIGPYAFSYDSSLSSLDIPDNVTYIGENAFLSNTWYESMSDGMIYFGKVAYKYKGDMAENSTITIKSGTVSIGDGAFENCSLASVTIPSSVTAIGEAAFSGTALKAINLPSKLETIGDEAFKNCSGITKLDIPSTVKYIGEKAFSGCSGISSMEIPDGVTVLNTYAFSGCTSLKNVKIPDSVTEIGLYVFSGCESLAAIDIPSSVQKIQGGAFSKTAISSIVIPDGVTSLNQYTFANCVNLTSVTIPDSVTDFGNSIFNGCTSLESIDLPDNLTAIGPSAFLGCSKLSSIDIPATVTTIGSKAFYKCDSLKTLTIPASVTTMNTKCVGFCYDTETKKDYVPADFTMICTADSAAEEYAVKNEINYTISGEVVTKTDISTCTVTLSGSSFTYTGSAIKPTVTVKNGSKTLTSGTDYTVAYSSNTNVGTATVTITGKGDYTGTVTKTFTITEAASTEKDISKCTVTLSKTSFTYTGSACKPKVTVTDGSKTLTLNTDYAVRYIDNIEVGTASVKIAGKGDYTGSVTKTFTITEATTKDLSDCTITLSKTVYKSDGTARKPKVTVKDGTKTLTLGTDYLVRYADNIEPGTASVIIAGRGTYTGRITKTFTILDSNAKQISDCTITLSKTQFTYTGNSCKPKVTVKDGDTVLTIGTDYNVRYVNNVNVGTATVVISGTGKYQGIVNKTFTIV